MNRRTLLVGAMAAGLMPATPLDAQSCAGSGRYIGELDLRALPDGRKMRLLAAYSYVDPCGLVWDVPAGIDLDGASIPREFWSVTGGPWDDKFRNASVIHDWFCVTKSRAWRKVHRMFYEAMLTSGVGPAKAAVMYAAVWAGGPRWAAPDRFNALLSARLFAEASEFRDPVAESVATEAEGPAETPPMSLDEFKALVQRIERDSLGPAEIETIVPR